MRATDVTVCCARCRRLTFSPRDVPPRRSTAWKKVCHFVRRTSYFLRNFLSNNCVSTIQERQQFPLFSEQPVLKKAVETRFGKICILGSHLGISYRLTQWQVCICNRTVCRARYIYMYMYTLYMYIYMCIIYTDFYMYITLTNTIEVVHNYSRYTRIVCRCLHIMYVHMYKYMDRNWHTRNVTRIRVLYMHNDYMPIRGIRGCIRTYIQYRHRKEEEWDHGG